MEKLLLIWRDVFWCVCDIVSDGFLFFVVVGIGFFCCYGSEGSVGWIERFVVGCVGMGVRWVRLVGVRLNDVYMFWDFMMMLGLGSRRFKGNRLKKDNGC